MCIARINIYGITLTMSSLAREMRFPDGEGGGGGGGGGEAR